MTFPSFNPLESWPRDFHAVVSVTLGELIEGKFVDWAEPSWHWDAYDGAQYARVCAKFNNHYWDREIGVLPPGSWKREVLRKFNEIMPKYKPIYKALADGADIMQASGTYGKHRDVYSDFPATQLKSDNQDYASNATDRQYEDITEGDWMEKMASLRNYDDVDYMIIKEMDSMFSSLFTVSTQMF